MAGEGVVTVDGRPIPEAPDLPRMHRDRMARLQEQLAAQELAGLVLLWPSAVSYADRRPQPGRRQRPGRAVPAGRGGGRRRRRAPPVHALPGGGAARAARRPPAPAGVPRPRRRRRRAGGRPRRARPERSGRDRRAAPSAAGRARRSRSRAGRVGHGAGQAAQDGRRAGVHPRRAALQRAGDVRRDAAAAARRPPDRAELGVPRPAVRARRRLQRHRPDLAADAAVHRGRAVDDARRCRVPHGQHR